MKRFVFLVLVVLAALPGERIVAQDAPVTTALTGSAFVYAVLALIAMIDDRVYVEAHPDVYRRAPAPMAFVRAFSERNGFAELVDWPAVAGVLRQQRGIATDVTKDE